MKKQTKLGFTIVKLAIVIALITVLAIVLVSAFGNVIKKAQDNKAIQQAKNAYAQHMIDNATEDEAVQCIVYEVDGRFVALENDAAVGLFANKEEAIASIIDDPSEFYAIDTKDPQLFLYKRRVVPEVKWEIGTIIAKSGMDSSSSTRLRTMEYLQLSDFGGLTLNDGYEITYMVYDVNYIYLGNGSRTNSNHWLASGVGIATADIKAIYPEGVYFRLSLKNTAQSHITVADLASAGIKFYAPDEKIVLGGDDLKYKHLFAVGPWQDGAIWDGKLFVLNSKATGKAYDLAQKTPLGTVTLDKKDILKPHANSVCFGSTKYEENDKYPLLYVNIYNNYSSSQDRMEGTCCVYRLTENEGIFSTQLVQVIRIGFTENLELWKSKNNNKDARPYGNFVVDTDNNKLYAFVMRDQNKTTRFFEFEMPSLDSGIYNYTYGCNVVTLNRKDICSQFDVEYFNYLQGCSYSNGKIFSVEGFDNDPIAPPALRIVDLNTQKLEKTYHLSDVGLTKEPEVICFDPEDGTLYYAAADGILRELTLSDSND